MLENDLLTEAFEVLSTQAKGKALSYATEIILNDRFLDLFLDKQICELSSEPTALQFSRDYVAKNRPVAIRGACSKWQAFAKWNADFFRYGLVIGFKTIFWN